MPEKNKQPFVKSLIQSLGEARDAKVGAVGAQQIRDAYSEGNNMWGGLYSKLLTGANGLGISAALYKQFPLVRTGLDIAGAIDGARNFFSGNGVQKAVRKIKEGDTWGAVKSGFGDVLDIAGTADLYRVARPYLNLYRTINRNIRTFGKTDYTKLLAEANYRDRILREKVEVNPPEVWWHDDNIPRRPGEEDEWYYLRGWHNDASDLPQTLIHGDSAVTGSTPGSWSIGTGSSSNLNYPHFEGDELVPRQGEPFGSKYGETIQFNKPAIYYSKGKTWFETPGKITDQILNLVSLDGDNALKYIMRKDQNWLPKTRYITIDKPKANIHNEVPVGAQGIEYQGGPIKVKDINSTYEYDPLIKTWGNVKYTTK